MAARFLTCGDSAVTVEFGDAIDERLNGMVHAFCAGLEQAGLPGIVEAVPTYRSATVHYSPDVWTLGAIQNALEPLAQAAGRAQPTSGAAMELPVLYGGEAGPDLEVVAAHCGLSEGEVVKRHSAPDYLIYMLGFTPGFPYLGGLDPQLETPRRAEPRVAIPAGSVGIAGAQTGVYPIASPGGWQLIGRTPLRLFDPRREPPILLAAGQRVRFVPIDRAEYDRLEQEARRD